MLVSTIDSFAGEEVAQYQGAYKVSDEDNTWLMRRSELIIVLFTRAGDQGIMAEVR